MAEATINVKLTEQDIQQIADRARADLARDFFARIGIPAAVPSVGTPWQGGIYTGIVRPEDGSEPYHLIVAAGDDGEATELAWGAYGESEPGAESKWDGKSNTLALVNSEHDHPAAEWAAGLRINGHDDWYLPAQRELMLCWVNVPELFAKEWHWSSTQDSSDTAWLQTFNNGYTYHSCKVTEARVRAVRRLPL